MLQCFSFSLLSAAVKQHKHAFDQRERGGHYEIMPVQIRVLEQLTRGLELASSVSVLQQTENARACFLPAPVALLAGRVDSVVSGSSVFGACSVGA